MDTGASYHTDALEDLTETEFKNLQPLSKPLQMSTANGDIWAKDQTQIYVHSLEMHVTALVVPTTTPPLLSVGSLAADNQVYFQWMEAGPTLLKPDGTKVLREQGVNIPIIAAAQAPKDVNENDLLGIATVATEGPSTTTTSGSSSTTKGDLENVDVNARTEKLGSHGDNVSAAVQDSSAGTVEKPVEASRKRDIPDTPSPDVPCGSLQRDSKGVSKRRRRNPKMKRGWAAPICKHNVFTHFPKDPNCIICRKSKTMRARCSRKSEDSTKPDSLPKPTAFGQFLSADHAIFNEGNASRLHDTVALIVQDSYTY